MYRREHIYYRHARETHRRRLWDYHPPFGASGEELAWQSGVCVCVERVREHRERDDACVRKRWATPAEERELKAYLCRTSYIRERERRRRERERGGQLWLSLSLSLSNTLSSFFFFYIYVLYTFTF